MTQGGAHEQPERTTRRSFVQRGLAVAALHSDVLYLAGSQTRGQASGIVACPGAYAGHLQGVCADTAGRLFWSFTTTLVRTSETGILQAHVPVPAHHGAPCVAGSRLYVAVNLTLFNDPLQHADSWVYVYDCDSLALVAKYTVPDVIYGAGGIVHEGSGFLVFGGAPAGSTEANLYRYDDQFQLQRQFALPTRHTRKGIQTAAFYGGYWWFGCYGDPNPVVLKTDIHLTHVEQFEFDCSLGIVALPSGLRVARGTIACDPAASCTGMILPARVSAGKLALG